MDTQVLIVGAGPTGLSLAITCRRFGLDVRIIDRAPAASQVSKALAVWSGSLEALAEMGAIDAFLAAGRRMEGVRIGDGKHQLATMSVGEGVDSPYPYALMLPQSQTEGLLADRLAALGVTVERQAELTSVAQDEEGVDVTINHAGGQTETIRAAYLAGCDGARSFVRHSLGIAFEGVTEPASYLLCDAPIEGDIDPASIYLWWHGTGTVAMFPIREGLWRIMAKREGAGEETPTAEEMQGHLTRHGPPGLILGATTWLSCFRINERLAAQYRQGRCFLLGDAAHVHSPAGGQGMNTGIQDGVNLGWKLGYTLRGWGEAGLLLDSYEPERRPVAGEVVKGATQRLHQLFGENVMLPMLRDMAIPLLTRIPAVRRHLQTELSETEIAYADGPLMELGGAPRHPRRTEVGGRARDAVLGSQPLWPILAGPAHTLLLFGAACGRDLSSLLRGAPDTIRVVRFDASSDPGGAAAGRYGLQEGWVLVRPDQVVAARGATDDWAKLSLYVQRVCGQSSG
jgi:2-polyprenyl-6-methoxyphenol hydroxylase-like FAD-dependent oxidoreductase